MSVLRLLISWLGWSAFLFPVYLLLAGTLDWQDLVIGALVAAVSAVATVAAWRVRRLHFRPRLRWLAPLSRVPGQVLIDCGVVFAALGRRLFRGQTVEGVFRTIPFDPGGDDPESAARRALILAAGSLAPNTYVIDVDRERGFLLVHQLVPTREPPGKGDREWPL